MQQDQPPISPRNVPAAKPPHTKKRRRNVLFSVVVPLALFILVIGGIAWIAQNVPNWRKPEQRAKSKKPALVFSTHQHEEQEHVVGSSGHFDFPFSTNATTGGTLGVADISCQCSNVKIAVFKPGEWSDSPNLREKLLEKADWQTALRSYRNGVALPPGGKGVVRVGWEDRNHIAKLLQLKVVVWFQPEGGDAKEAQLLAPLRLADPIRCMPAKLDLGQFDDLGEASKYFWCWSPFYDSLDLEVVERNPLFQYKISPMDKEKRATLIEALEKKKDSTTVKAAMRVEVRAFAKKEDKQLDLGPFVRQIVLKARGKVFDKIGPLLLGRVQGPVMVGSFKDQGRIQLPTFFAAEGISQTVRIRASQPMQLEVAKTVPPTLIAVDNVKLEKAPTSTETRPVWSLTITIPSGKANLGHLPDNCAVFLQTKSKQPRLIRIPIQGYAKRR